ncbi:hypothetical protein B0T14DRAFT_517569 [Immersiella caudata]|uniref:Uncharacterized protein n=1 Tax=Immersiella caudata TaxID=314043 RepID=A0AA39WYS5_9PEZI|nr:hypothetical protein B0T14DRAFT_517569 [Immersiella caudata]
MGLLPRLRSPFLVLLLLIHTSLAVILTNTEYNLQIGVPFTITWAEAAGPVRIDLYGGDNGDTLFELQAIATSVDGTSFIWTPADVPQRNAYAIVVSDGISANAISFAFTFNAVTTTSTSTTPPTTSSTTQPPTTTSSSSVSNTLTTSAPRITAATVSSNTTFTTPTNTVPTSAPSGPPTAAADVVGNVPGAQRGDTSQVLSTAAKVGIGLAAGVGIIAIVAGSVIMILKKNKQYDQEEKELEDGSGGEGVGLGTGGSSPELGMGGWKTAEKRPEGAAIEMAPRSSLTGMGAGPGPDVGRAVTPVAGRPVTPTGRPVTPTGRLTPGRPATPNAPRTPSPLAKEVDGSPPAGTAR